MTTDHYSSASFPSNEWRISWLNRCLGGFGLALFAATYRLWLPQADFPQIPAFEFLVGTPGWIDWGCLAMVAIGLLIPTFNRGKSVKIPWIVFGLASMMLILLNQHRLQPWAYQWLVYAALLSLLPIGSFLFWMRAIVISIYFYSALSKFDYQFLRTVGPEMLSVVFPSLESMTETTQANVAAILPAGELILAVSLIIPGRVCRFIGLSLGSIMHTGLLLILGPWGMDQLPGVLVWNLFFLAQLWILFYPHREYQPANGQSPDSQLVSGFRLETHIGQSIAALVLLLPLTQPLGWCDHWLAWELYAPRTSRIELTLPHDLELNLPVRIEAPAENMGLDLPNLNQYLDRTVDLAAWSESALGVPIYPQARFQLGCCRAIQAALPADESRTLECTLLSASNRWSGKRERIPIDLSNRDTDRAEPFWLNTYPRGTFKGFPRQ